MSLASGTKLGPYEILAPIGAGGMGTVYRARDARLGRDVAIKVSSEQFSERFEGEARSIAALNHPNICQLYDVGPNFLVMELIEGAPLRGPLPLKKALDYARQILEALDAAHSKGITHRDLKPTNILVTKKGIKLLDFGLAKQSGPLKETDVTQALTQQGAIVGTLNYMSPEQLQTKEADARSDIFSFGLVLYEMLTGKRAFQGPRAASVIAAIIEREPPSMTGMAPVSLDRLLRRCLAKQPEDRWQSARDLKHAIDDFAFVPAPAPVSARRWWPLIAGLLAIFVGVSIALTNRNVGPVEPYELAIPAPPGVTFEFSVGKGGFTISPDGRNIAFAAQDALWVRPLGSREARKLPGTDRAYYPFFSSDGKSVAYFDRSRLMKIDLGSGAVAEVTSIDGGAGRGGTWNEDGTILFASINRSIYRVPSSGGPSSRVTTVDLARGENAHYFPSFLPDGEHFLYAVRSYEGANNGIFAGSLRDPRVKVKVASVFSNATFVPPSAGGNGYLLYCRDGKLLAQPFEASTLRTTRDPTVLGEPGVLPNQSMANFAASRDGTVVIGGAGLNKDRMTWLDMAGKELSAIGSPDSFFGPHISPDGSRVVLNRYVFGRTGGIVVFDLARGITLELGAGAYPFWSPDGKGVIYFQANKILLKDPDSVASPTLLAELQEPFISLGDISPDGKYVAVRDSRGLMITRLGQDKSEPIAFGDASNPRFSPDGRYIAYVGGAKPGIYVEKFPERTFRTLVANAGTELVWRRDGKQLYFVLQGRMLAVDVREADKRIVFGPPRELFPFAQGGTPVDSGYDVSPDGTRFLRLIEQESSRAENELTVLLNWREASKE